MAAGLVNVCESALDRASQACSCFAGKGFEGRMEKEFIWIIAMWSYVTETAKSYGVDTDALENFASNIVSRGVEKMLIESAVVRGVRRSVIVNCAGKRRRDRFPS